MLNKGDEKDGKYIQKFSYNRYIDVAIHCVMDVYYYLHLCSCIT